MRKIRKMPAILVILIMFLLILLYIYIAYETVKPADDIICEGVFIEDIDLGGMNREQAQTAVQNYIDSKMNRVMEVKVNDKTVSVTLDKLGYSCEENNYIEQALQLGKQSNPLVNYANIKRAQKEHIVYDLTFTCSEEKITDFIKEECGKKCTKAKNANIKMKSGALTYTDAKDGIAVDVDTTLQEIKNVLLTQEAAKSLMAEATVTIQEPAVTKELASRCKDKIGTFRTTFNAGKVARSSNVANAARLINGKVVYPGETFSVHDAISPLTEENGYYAAPSYSNGKVEDSIGGGVCQVSTTLYNAVLRAELEIVERSPHSMVVSYVEPSMDAAIAGDYKDFKFRNNMEVPIYIEGGTYSGTIYFNVYGEETRSADRKVTFKSETLETIQPGADKVTYDKKKPTSYEKVTQEAHVGYKAILWKIVKENGKTEKTQINSSTYQAEPRYVVKGSAKEKPKPSATPKPKSTAKPKATATPMPTSTATPMPVQ